MTDQAAQPAAERETRLFHSARAAIRLFLFGIGTIIGYVIYETMLRRVSAELLTLNTFFWLIAYYSLGATDRAIVWSWRPLISLPVVQFALGQFAYWYAFWIGIKAGGAPVVLAVLALTMVATPLMVRSLEEKERRSSLKWTLGIGLILLCSVVLIKLDLPVSELLDADAVMAKLDGALLYPLACMVIAVIAEGFTDRTVYHLRQQINNQKAEQFQQEYAFVQAAEKEQIEKAPVSSRGEMLKSLISKRASTEMRLKSLPITFGLSCIVMVLHGSWGVPVTAMDFGRWGWLIVWLMLLAILGSSARPILVAPLQAKGLDADTLPPIMAGRQVLYFAATWLTVWYVHWLDLQCPSNARCLAFGHLEVNTAIVPAGHFSYWVGALMALAIWIVAWTRFFRIGFFKQKQP